jgi:hypothetical protein
MNTDPERLRRLAELEDGCSIGVGGALVRLQKLAEFLHTENCTHNHADHCAWFYEKEWTAYTHNLWLHKAEQLLTFLDSL